MYKLQFFYIYFIVIADLSILLAKIATAIEGHSRSLKLAPIDISCEYDRKVLVELFNSDMFTNIARAPFFSSDFYRLTRLYSVCCLLSRGICERAARL